MRILALGDSLTAGYHDSGNSFSPWAPLLCKLLGVEAVDHVGYSGFTTGQILQAKDLPIVRDVVPREWPGYCHQLSTHKYDVVLILVGTNDFADKVPADAILANIVTLHEIAHQAGARTIAMSAPESKAALHVPWLGALRREANEAIRTWAQAQPSSHVAFVDAAAIVPFSETAVPRLWEYDGLHMTADGYKALGHGLARMTREFICGQMPSDHMRTGATVRICGLTRAPQHNGKVGTVNGRIGRDGRLGVEVAGGHVLALRRDNIELLDEIE